MKIQIFKFQGVLPLKQYLRKLWWKLHSSKKYWTRQAAFRDSQTYWEERYNAGGSSGSGSYGKLKEFKADVINKFLREHEIRSVIEFGCGDGNQLLDMAYPQYLGLDVSPTAVQKCKNLFKDDRTKEFRVAEEYKDETADLSLSLDVLYHLVEDAVFENYLKKLFLSSNKYVIIYSSNEVITRKNQGHHVRHRKFTSWVDANIEGWRILHTIKNKYPFNGVPGEGSHADFFIYEKVPDKHASVYQ